MTLSRRSFVRLVGTALPLAAACRPVVEEGAASADPARARAEGPTEWAGYDDAIVIDALAGPIQFNIAQQTLPLEASVLDQVRASGISALNLTVNAAGRDGVTAYDATVARMSGWRGEVERHPGVFAQVRSVADIRAAAASGRLGIVFGFQDGVPFQDDLDRLEPLHAQGLRIVQLTYNVENRLGSGCLAPTDSGLTELGREVVARMDAMRILVDLSHCGARTTLDGLRASMRPVSITHSGCNAVFAHPRNKDDEALRLLADGGGVIGVFLMPFLNPSGPPGALDVLRHVEHALDVCGEDHVGIGSDQGIVPLDVGGDFQERFEAVSAQRSARGIAAPREDTIPYVPELNHPRRLATIAGLMESRGHPARVIEKVIGGNFLRLFGEVWGEGDGRLIDSTIGAAATGGRRA